MKVFMKSGTYQIEEIRENIVRCVYTKKESASNESALGIAVCPSSAGKVAENEDCLEFKTERICLKVDKRTGSFLWKRRSDDKILLREEEKELTEIPYMRYTTDGEEPIIKRVQTVDGERNFVQNLRAVEAGSVYKGKLRFQWGEEEQLHGFGQGEEGIYDYRGAVQYLYQHNMRIPMPFFVSNKGYGILVDCGSLMTFQDDVRGAYLYLDAVKQLDYYLIQGDTLDEIISGFRLLTGKAVMLPKWAYGYVQSKEAYVNQEEILQTAQKYRELHIPLDCIVQDWNTWEAGKWGNKRVDKKRYSDISQMNRQLHEMHVHSMVSVWPNMNAGTEDYEEMKDVGHLLNDNATYDAFSKEARKIYWKQMERELFSGGFDSWWCDSTEPFSGPDWNGEYKREPWERFLLVGNEHKKFLGADRANLYAVEHAKGIYENQRAVCDKKRVLNLTRSGYASSQKYGTVLWSGDICASWDTFRKQICEGLNMCMSGMPYWTLDIGGFFTVNENWKHRGCFCNEDPTPKWFWKGEYEDGTADLGYRELYVRWFEYGAFLPMFRSHGTDTPREVWHFGNEGELFYDALVKTIKMRYRLMPYIYSMAGKVWLEDSTLMRSLLFDFSEDEKAAALGDEFMFGDSLLVCPVTQAMYYGRNSQKLEIEKTWSCYLPKGTDWYDFFTGERYAGGITVQANAPIDKVPVFVKAGAILPMEIGLQYAEEVVESPLEIHIYPGKDGQFWLYEDSGDGYEYEKEIYNRILLEWNDRAGVFQIGEADYKFAQGIIGRVCKVSIEGTNRVQKFVYDGKLRKIEL